MRKLKHVHVKEFYKSFGYFWSFLDIVIGFEMQIFSIFNALRTKMHLIQNLMIRRISLHAAFVANQVFSLCPRLK